MKKFNQEKKERQFNKKVNKNNKTRQMGKDAHQELKQYPLCEDFVMFN